MDYPLKLNIPWKVFYKTTPLNEHSLGVFHETTSIALYETLKLNTPGTALCVT